MKDLFIKNTKDIWQLMIPQKQQLQHLIQQKQHLQQRIQHNQQLLKLKLTQIKIIKINKKIKMKKKRKK